MSSRLILVDRALVVIYVIMSERHRVAEEMLKARDIRASGHISPNETREIAEALDSACRRGDETIALATLYATQRHYSTALTTLALSEAAAPDERSVSVYRWDPRFDGPEPPFRYDTDTEAPRHDQNGAGPR